MSWLTDWGHSSSNTTTDQSTNPWAPAQPALNSILGGVGAMAGNTGLTGAESGALGGLQNLANQGNPYATGISGYANNMLAGGGANNNAGMVNGAYDTYTNSMNPTARGDYLDPNKNPFFAQTTQTIGNDVQSRVNGMFAGAGRDMSGMNMQTLARGISEGTAPTYANQYNQERTNQLNAQNSLYSAGNNTAGILGNFQNQFNQNQGQGVQGANAALTAANSPYTQTLAIEAQRRGIPLSLMQQLAGIATPIAGLGGTSHGTSNTQTDASGMQQFQGLMSGIGSLFSGSGGGAGGQGKSAAQQIAAMMGG